MGNEYNQKSVQQAIDADPSIGTTEAALIHGLLKGWRAAPRMMPGQEPYNGNELRQLYALVSAAADSDPGEQHEPQLTYRVEVRVTGEQAWTRNGVVFNTESEAEAECARISRAWTAVAETRIQAAGYQEE